MHSCIVRLLMFFCLKHLANYHRLFDQNLVKIEEHINTGDLQSNTESKLGSRLVFGRPFFVPAPIFIDSWPWQRAAPPPSDLPWDRSKLKKQPFFFDDGQKWTSPGSGIALDPIRELFWTPSSKKWVSKPDPSKNRKKLFSIFFSRL